MRYTPPYCTDPVTLYLADRPAPTTARIGDLPLSKTPAGVDMLSVVKGWRPPLMLTRWLRAPPAPLGTRPHARVPQYAQSEAAEGRLTGSERPTGGLQTTGSGGSGFWASVCVGAGTGLLTTAGQWSRGPWCRVVWS